MSDTQEVLAPFKGAKRNCDSVELRIEPKTDRPSRDPNMDCDSLYTGKSAFPAETSVAMAYIPFQLCTTTFDPQVALEKGTLFPILYKPWGRLK